jgi:hypothetical protein
MLFFWIGQLYKRASRITHLDVFLLCILTLLFQLCTQTLGVLADYGLELFLFLHRQESHKSAEIFETTRVAETCKIKTRYGVEHWMFEVCLQQQLR